MFGKIISVLSEAVGMVSEAVGVSGEGFRVHSEGFGLHSEGFGLHSEGFGVVGEALRINKQGLAEHTNEKFTHPNVLAGHPDTISGQTNEAAIPIQRLYDDAMESVWHCHKFPEHGNGIGNGSERNSSSNQKEAGVLKKIDGQHESIGAGTNRGYHGKRCRSVQGRVIWRELDHLTPSPLS